jgi:hypothetical protein
VSGEYLARLKVEQPDVNWDAEMMAARLRRDRARRSWWNRLTHRIHALQHPELHRSACSACKRA